MSRRRVDSRPLEQGPVRPDGSYVTVRELDARIDSVKTELKWQRWLLLVLVAATIAPKLGAPAVPTIAAEIVRHIA